MTQTEKALALVLDYGSAIQSGNLHKSKQAYAALKELLEAREGWRLVPVEPDEDMCFATTHIRNDIERSDVEDMLRAAIASSPEPEA